MTSKGPTAIPPEPRGGGARKRPTLDLKATEVASEPIAPPLAAEPPSEAPAPPSSAQQPVAAVEPPPSESGPAAAPQAAAAPPSQPAAEAVRPERPVPRTGPAIAWLPPNFPWPVAAAGAAGVALTLLVFAVAGMVGGRDAGPSALEVRLTRVEQQVRELVTKPQALAVEPRTVDDLIGRVARLEAAMATPRPPSTDPAVANRIALLEGEAKALSERIGVLARRNDEIASLAAEARKRADAAALAAAEFPKAGIAGVPRAEVDALAKRVVALEQAAKALEAESGRRTAGGGDLALRLVVLASALGIAVDRGVPFAAELEVARAVAPDPKALAPLTAFAAAGVPSAESLARELVSLLPAIAKAAGLSAGEGGFFDRLKANAEKVIRVRPLDEPVGDDPAAVLRRIEARAAQRNLAGAVAELAKLPPPARALAKEWLAKVAARDAAIEASRRFVAAAFAALGKPSL